MHSIIAFLNQSASYALGRFSYNLESFTIACLLEEEVHFTENTQYEIDWACGDNQDHFILLFEVE